MFTLAHLSDPHVGNLPRPRLSELVGKRFLGFLSWQLRRRRIHDGPVLGVLAADLATIGPTHIAVTGDLVNISLPGEFDNATRWLGSLGSPDAVTIIPGNHDAYVPMPWPESAGRWAAFMAGSRLGDDKDEQPLRSEADFPFIRLRGPVALVGVSTAQPMPFYSAGGRVGPRQLAALGDRLRQLGRDGLFRIVLIHHPPFDERRHRRKRLYDSKAFQDVIAAAGAELVLHGHTHRSGLTKIATPTGYAPVIGVPSASARADHGGKNHARYHLYRLRRNDSGWTLDVEVRGVTPALDRFVSEGRFSLMVPH